MLTPKITIDSEVILKHGETIQISYSVLTFTLHCH